MAKTKFKTKCDILSDLWLLYRNDQNYEDIFAYGDLGFTLAYAISNEIVEKTDKAKGFVEELFDLLLARLELEDEGFKDLDDLLESVAV